MYRFAGNFSRSRIDQEFSDLKWGTPGAIYAYETEGHSARKDFFMTLSSYETFAAIPIPVSKVTAFSFPFKLVFTFCVAVLALWLCMSWCSTVDNARLADLVEASINARDRMIDDLDKDGNERPENIAAHAEASQELNDALDIYINSKK
jgi:hypothetical protein